MKTPDNLKAIDITSLGSFVRDEVFEAFSNTELGQDIMESITAQYREHYNNDDLELTDSQMHRALFDLQIDQERSASHIVSYDEMMDLADDGFDFGELISDAKELAEGLVESAANSAVGFVTNNDGLSGRAADALENRADTIDNAIRKIQTPDTPGM